MVSKEHLPTHAMRFKTEVLETYARIYTPLKAIIDLISYSRFDETDRHILEIFEASDLLEKQIKTYMTQEILGIFETEAKLSYSLEETEREKDRVFKWLDEIRQMTEQLQNKLTADKKDQDEIRRDFSELQRKIFFDLPLRKFVNTLRFLVLEFERYRDLGSTEELTSIFDNLKLHAIIRKSSKTLFQDGHYASAIFEAYKSLNNYVKKKSKRKDLDGKILMTKVFSFRYDRATDQIQSQPLLQLNELRNESERDEQEGFMHLFMGSILGIRNPKAHDLIEQKDPFRTLEYLSLASLLAKRVDEAKLTC